MYRTKNSKNQNNNNSNQKKHHNLFHNLLPRRGNHKARSNDTTTTTTTSEIVNQGTMTTESEKSFTERESSTTLDDANTESLPIVSPEISVERAMEAAAASESLSAVKSKSRLIPPDQLRQVYTVPENLRTMEDGGCLFSFVCNHKLTPYQAEMVDSFVNLSGFDDEEKENFVPKFHYSEYMKQRRQELEQESDTASSKSGGSKNGRLPNYTFLLARCGYLLTGVDFAEMIANPTLLTTLDYQRACQPEGTKVWEDYDLMGPDNFRITKPIIPYIYSFTIQFRVSRVKNPEDLQRLSKHLGIPVDGAIVLERTKRSVPPKEDATKKTKSVLVYTDLGQGVVLVTHLTVMLQCGLPEVVERIIGTVGQWGLGETAETAWRTRTYLQKKMPFAPTEPAFFLDAASEAPEEEESKQSGQQQPRGQSDEDDDDDDDFFDAVDADAHGNDVLVH